MTRMNMDWNLKKLGAANLFIQVLERFSCDLEMKTSEQNRKSKRTHRATDWFIERIQMRLAFGWLSERYAEKKTFSQNKFLEINRYFALTSCCNTIGQSNNAFSILGKTKSPCVDLFIHWLITLTKTIFQGHAKIALMLYRQKFTEKLMWLVLPGEIVWYLLQNSTGAFCA